MENTLDILDILKINKKTKKLIELTHCLQIPSNEMAKFHYDLKKDAKYIFLGNHGLFDKILRIEKDNTTQFFLGHWNDGVIE